MSLFGSVEYFEKEIIKYLTKKQTENVSQEHLLAITAKLKKELLYDFVCDDKIKRECIANLISACGKLKGARLHSA